MPANWQIGTLTSAHKAARNINQAKIPPLIVSLTHPVCSSLFCLYTAVELGGGGVDSAACGRFRCRSWTDVFRC